MMKNLQKSKKKNVSSMLTKSQNQITTNKIRILTTNQVVPEK